MPATEDLDQAIALLEQVTGAAASRDGTAGQRKRQTSNRQNRLGPPWRREESHVKYRPAFISGRYRATKEARRQPGISR